MTTTDGLLIITEKLDAFYGAVPQLTHALAVPALERDKCRGSLELHQQ